MKMFKENEQSLKSWAIKLHQMSDGNIELNAVDATTGNHICHLLFFGESGEVEISENAVGALRRKGYDPFEHYNSWTESGEILID